MSPEPMAVLSTIEQHMAALLTEWKCMYAADVRSPENASGVASNRSSTPPMSWKAIGKKQGETYHWPDSEDSYIDYTEYESDVPTARPSHLAIGTVAPLDDWWGKRRAYRVVFALGEEGGAKEAVAVFNEP